LRQEPETLVKLRARIRYAVVSHALEFRVELAAPFRSHRALSIPNTVNKADLDSFSVRTTQLAFGTASAKAILAANLQRPDSSAALLLEPNGRGSLWYCSFPIAERAAAGYEAEQKLLANLISYR
jgi:hypothetical protein